MLCFFLSIWIHLKMYYDGIKVARSVFSLIEIKTSNDAYVYYLNGFIFKLFRFLCLVRCNDVMRSIGVYKLYRTEWMAHGEKIELIPFVRTN